MVWAPNVIRPCGLLQEDLQDAPWKLLIVCKVVKQAGYRQARKIIFDFFKWWPGPPEIAIADPGETVEMSSQQARN